MPIFRIALCIIVCVMIASCSDVNGPADWYDENSSATIKMARVVKRTFDSTTVTDHLYAAFYHPDTVGGIAVGAVRFNDTEIPSSFNATPGEAELAGTQYLTSIRELGQSPVRFDGAPVQVSVAGNEKFPSVAHSVAAPFGQLDVSYPPAREVLSREAGFTINWAGKGSDRQVIVTITELSLSAETHTMIVPDNGTLRVDPEVLSKFRNGPVIIDVQRNHTHYVTAPGRRMIGMHISSEVSTMVTFAR